MTTTDQGTTEAVDVVIVGARCAGSPLAAMLASAGRRVAVIDAARLPSDTASTHIIQPRGVAVLERLGVLDRVLDAGGAVINRMSLQNEDVLIEGGSPDGNFAVCLRRPALDGILLDAARAAGADVRLRTKVTGLVRGDDGRVIGVDTDAGRVPAGLVIGADGRESTVAQLVGAREYHVTEPGRLFVWGYFAGVSDRGGHVRFGRLGDYIYLACPCDDGLYMAGIGVPMDRREQFLAARHDGYAAAIAGWPDLADRLAGAERVGPLRCVPDWHGYFRDSAGPGWALLGDAGHFKDPTPGQGIADAFVQAEALAAAVLGAHGDAHLDAALHDWWRWRDQDCLDMYWFATDMGAAGVATPLFTNVLRDIADDPDGATDLLRVMNHERTSNQLLHPARLARAAVRTARRHPSQLGALAREVGETGRQEIRRARARRISARV